MQSQAPKHWTFSSEMGRLSLVTLVFVLGGLSLGRSEQPIYGGDIPRGSQLVQLSVIYRHGDRNPKSSYPKSEFSNLKHWSEGWGQLTLAGMKQQERFGRALKAMYGPKGYGLLPMEYNLKVYKVVSTDKDRTIMSAMANNAGLWRPPPDKGIDEPEVQWKAVPVRVIAKNKYDTIFAQNCLRAKQLVERHRNDYFEALKNQHYEMFAYLEKHSGHELLKYPSRINWLYDTLTIERIKKGKIPEWAEGLYPQPLQSFLMEYYKQGAVTKEMKRLTGGPLLKTIITTMKNYTEGKNTLKMNVFSAHETNIYNILAALGILLEKPPGYTGALLFELFKYQESYIVRLLYRPGPELSAVPVLIPGCQGHQSCSLKTFMNIVADVLPEDLVAECS